MRSARNFGLLVIALFLALHVLAAPVRSAPEIEVKETPLGLTRKVLLKSLVASPDGKRLAYVNSKGKGKNAGVELVVDGKADPNDYDGLAENGIAFSPDSKHVAFLAQTKGKWVVVVDGVAGPAYSTYTKGSLTFSPDSARWMVAADQGGKRLLLLDGKPGKIYDDVAHPRFSADGTRVAYAARVGQQWLAVIDGVEGAICDEILDDTVQFSPDSKRTAYVARTGDKWSIITGTGEPKAYDSAARGTLVFSPDSQHLACAVARGADWVVVDNGVESKPCDRIVVSSVVFSPNGKSLSFISQHAGKERVVTNGVDGPAFDSISPPIYSPDSKHLVYMTSTEKEVTPDPAKTPAKHLAKEIVKEATVIFDGKPEGTYARIISMPIFSSDSAHHVFVALRDRHVFVVADGKEGAMFDEVLNVPVFSSDGKRMAFPARRAKQQFAVIDGKESEPADAIGRLTFSPDGAHVAFGTQSGGDLRLVIDSTSTAEFGGFIHGATLVFDGPTSLNTVVFRGPQLLGLHLELKEQK